jgi:hypothetical protein
MNDYSLTYLFIIILYTRFQFLCQGINTLVVMLKKSVLHFLRNMMYLHIFIANSSRNCGGLQVEN